MYNYQSYLRQSKLNKKCQQVRREYYQSLQHKQKTNPSLIHSHKKRIQGFILSMVQNPSPINIYQDYHYQPRMIKEAKSLIHQKKFTLNRHNDKERLEESFIKNQVCDPVPFNNTYTHKFREIKGELKAMRYTARNASMRVKEHLDSTMLNYLPNLQNKKIDKVIKSPNFSFKDRNLLKKLNKSLLPLMHKKTYFQSLKSIFTQIPHHTPLQPYQKQPHLPSQHDEFDTIQRKDKKQSGQTMNRKENSRQALVKCGLIGGKNTVYRVELRDRPIRA